MTEPKLRFNPPPGWPVPPDFAPPPGWRPDLAWPTPPADWKYWVADDAATARPHRRFRFRSWVRWGVLGIGALLLLIIGISFIDSGTPSATRSAVSVRASASPPTTAAAQTPPTSSATPSAPPTPTRSASPRPPSLGTALAAVASLPVKGRAPLTGYTREQFGPAWADVDRNGCDTRNDVLRRDLRPVTVQLGTHGCRVLSGTLADPYTGRPVAFTRGVRTSSQVQIDHVVALADAWQKGAQQWPAARREAFANDPLELLAVDGTANLRKGAGDAATWLPPNKSFRCAYVARQVSIKRNYGLWVTAAERDAMDRVLRTCPRQPLVSEAAARRPKTPVAAVAAPPAPRPPAPRPLASTRRRSSAAPVIEYPNCAAVRAAGAAPLRRGQPGYSRKLDRDGDGVACE